MLHRFRYLVERDIDESVVSGKRNLDDGSVELFGHRRLSTVICEFLRFDNHLPIVTAQFAKDAISGNGDGLVLTAQGAPQTLDEIGAHRLDVVIKVVGEQIVHAQLECAQALAHQSG